MISDQASFNHFNLVFFKVSLKKVSLKTASKQNAENFSIDEAKTRKHNKQLC